MKYERLKSHFERLQGNVTEISYGEIERILGFKLPGSAYGTSYRQWWANTPSHSQAQAWLEAGWRVAGPNRDRQIVKFVRSSDVKSGSDGPAASDRGSSAIVLPREKLNPSALRLLEDAAEEAGTDLVEAAVELLNRAATARRRQVLDWFAQHANGQGSSSTALIREDRDAR